MRDSRVEPITPSVPKTGPYRLSDYTWGSVGRYIQHVEVNTGVVAIAASAIWSFKFDNDDPLRLSRSKNRTLLVLNENLRRIATYAGDRREEMTDDERVVLRSYYRTLQDAIGLVKDHIERADGIAGAMMRTLVFDWENQDEPPF